eukprot:253203-Ditylum_brightwellii.AAC.1
MLGRCIGLRGTIKAFLRDEVFRNWATDCCHTSSEAPISALHQAQRRNSSGSPQTPPLLSSAALEQNMPPLRRFTYCSIRLLLNRLLEFPLLISPSVSNTGSSFSLSSMNVQDERSERKEEMHALLRDFASSSATAPVHLLLFPEGWSLEGYSTCCCNNHTENPNSEIQSLADRRSVMAKSVEFAKREGRPQLRHLLLPRTKGFNATLQSLRESSPVVYDMTMVREIFTILTGIILIHASFCSWASYTENKHQWSSSFILCFDVTSLCAPWPAQNGIGTLPSELQYLVSHSPSQ